MRVCVHDAEGRCQRNVSAKMTVSRGEGVGEILVSTGNGVAK